MKNVIIIQVALFLLFILNGCKTHVEYKCLDCGIGSNSLYFKSSSLHKGIYSFGYDYLSGSYCSRKGFLVLKSDTVFDSFPIESIKIDDNTTSSNNVIILENFLLDNDSVFRKINLMKRYLIADKDTFEINWRDTLLLDKGVSSFYLFFDYSERNEPLIINGKTWYINFKIVTTQVKSKTFSLINDRQPKIYNVSFRMPYNLWFKKDLRGDSLFKRGDTLWYKKENRFYVPVKTKI